MIEKINNHTPKYLILNSFSHNPTKRNGYLSYRYHRTKKAELKEEIRSMTGAIIGTAIPLILFAKKQNKNIFKLHYGLSELVGVSAGGIIGGVLGGVIGADRYDRKTKVNEGIFQFSNSALPPAIVAGLMKVTQNVKFLNNTASKIGLTLLGITGGMFFAAKAANFVADPEDSEKDRKLTIKDSLANMDDAIGALAMNNFPVLQKIAGPLLPFIYVMCGFRAGDSN